MYRFFVSPEQIGEDEAVIIGLDVNHIKNVLRLKVEDELTISDGNGKDYYCIIRGISDEEIQLEVQYKCDTAYELNKKITLFQGVPKKDKMEWIVQKSVELGVYDIVPIMMKRTIVKLDSKSSKKKQERWQSIATAAAKQSKRSIVPQVHEPMAFSMIDKLLAQMDLVIVPYENKEGIAYTREVLSNLKDYDRIGIIIGPEGGFDIGEVNFLEEYGAKIISLGKRILRTETAGLTTLSYLMIQIEEDD